jgi:hypothetical protein
MLGLLILTSTCCNEKYMRRGSNYYIMVTRLVRWIMSL